MPSVVALRPAPRRPAAKPTAPKNCYLRGETWWFEAILGGVRHRESLLTTDAREAGTRAEAIRQRLGRQALGVPGEESWQAAVVRWSREVGATVKIQTAARYIGSIRHFDAAFGGLLMSAVDRRAIADWQSARLAQGKLPSGQQAGSTIEARELGEVTMATVRRDLSALSSLMGACESWGWLQSNPALDALRHGKEKKRVAIRPPTRAEVNFVIARAPDGVAGVLRILLETGCRTAEAVGMERWQVDASRGRIILDRTKSGRPRVLPLVTPAADAGPVLEAGASTGFLYTPEGSREPFKNFSSNVGQLQRRLVREAAEASKAAKARGEIGHEPVSFRRFRAHDIRARFAVDWLLAGGSLARLSKHLGHASVKITEQHYLDWLTGEEQERVRREANSLQGES